MKRKTFLFTLMILVCSVTFGQLRKGIQVGAGSSWVNSKTKQESAISYSAGIVGEYKLKNGFVINGGLNYERKGATLLDQPEQHQTNGLIDEYEFHLDYITLPLSIGYPFSLGGNFAFTPRIGVYGAFGVGGYGLITTHGLYPQEELKTTFRVEPFEDTQGRFYPGQPYQHLFRGFQRPDIGLVIGTDFDISKHFRFSLQSEIGVLYFLNHYDPAGTIRLRTLNVSVGYFF